MIGLEVFWSLVVVMGSCSAVIFLLVILTWL